MEIMKHKSIKKGGDDKASEKNYETINFHRVGANSRMYSLKEK